MLLSTTTTSTTSTTTTTTLLLHCCCYCFCCCYYCFCCCYQPFKIPNRNLQSDEIVAFVLHLVCIEKFYELKEKQREVNICCYFVSNGYLLIHHASFWLRIANVLIKNRTKSPALDFTQATNEATCAMLHRDRVRVVNE